jgi:hypothetical protein
LLGALDCLFLPRWQPGFGWPIFSVLARVVGALGKPICRLIRNKVPEIDDNVMVP